MRPPHPISALLSQCCCLYALARLGEPIFAGVASCLHRRHGCRHRWLAPDRYWPDCMILQSASGCVKLGPSRGWVHRAHSSLDAVTGHKVHRANAGWFGAPGRTGVLPASCWRPSRRACLDDPHPCTYRELTDVVRAARGRRACLDDPDPCTRERGHPARIMILRRLAGRRTPDRVADEFGGPSRLLSNRKG
jgi:hypothetical protein